MSNIMSQVVGPQPHSHLVGAAEQDEFSRASEQLRKGTGVKKQSRNVIVMELFTKQYQCYIK